MNKYRITPKKLLMSSDINNIVKSFIKKKKFYLFEKRLKRRKILKNEQL